MSKKRLYILVTICFLLASLAIGCQSSGEQSNKIISLEKQLNDLQSQNAELQNQITVLTKELSDSQQKIEILQEQTTGLTEATKELTDNIINLGHQLESLSYQAGTAFRYLRPNYYRPQNP